MNDLHASHCVSETTAKRAHLRHCIHLIYVYTKLSSVRSFLALLGDTSNLSWDFSTQLGYSIKDTVFMEDKPCLYL